MLCLSRISITRPSHTHLSHVVLFKLCIWILPHSSCLAPPPPPSQHLIVRIGISYLHTFIHFLRIFMECVRLEVVLWTIHTLINLIIWATWAPTTLALLAAWGYVVLEPSFQSTTIQLLNSTGTMVWKDNYTDMICLLRISLNITCLCYACWMNVSSEPHLYSTLNNCVWTHLTHIHWPVFILLRQITVDDKMGPAITVIVWSLETGFVRF